MTVTGRRKSREERRWEVIGYAAVVVAVLLGLLPY